VRAFETASIVAAPHGLTVTPDARLREFAFGEWEGLTWDEILAKHPHLRAVDVTAAKNYTPAGGETFADVTLRVGSFFDELVARAGAGERVVVVTHAGPLHAALGVLKTGLEDAAGPISVSFAAASLTRITMEHGVARLISLSDVRHLHPAR
jgi:broad specificity phosphatase PhoE